MNSVVEICKSAHLATSEVASFDTNQKNQLLEIAANAISSRMSEILSANSADVTSAKKANMPPQFIDRLTLNESRILDMAIGLRALIDLPNPIGEVIESFTAESGILIKKVRVPLGVIGIIYEARPNVTVDAIGLCIKTGNSVVLRGSKDAILSNKALVDVIKASFEENGYSSNFIQLVPDVSREGANQLMKCREYVDVLLPRGSASLINTVVENSTIPVIETGAGNCHAYIESSAKYDMVENIVLNGKLQRPSVCNALESLVISRDALASHGVKIINALLNHGVEVVGDDETTHAVKGVKPASAEDFYKEYNALKISVKVVSDVYEAVKHVNECSTHHSEVIITENAKSAEYFLSAVDSAAVYHNASTRFTDGFQFGFGAEMGISTQKLHARGPLGLKQLTSEKYVIYGKGQVRK